ncbi:MAG: tripartite tricarboxylate transporter TctB family protein [Alphaproteobacteria bacterium]|nr:tripartite tricarboxylate transporter TctB family protein [Alphaproteobacteria bacterium]
MGIRLQIRSLLTVFFIIVFAYVLYESKDMPEQARLYPYTIAIIALALLTWQIVREVFFSQTPESRETGADVDFTEEEASVEGRKRAFELFVWVYAFGFALWVLGFFVAIPVMVFLYLLRHREGWVVTIAMPVVAGGATWLLFNNLLHLPFPPGVVFEMLGWD